MSKLARPKRALDPHGERARVPLAQVASSNRLPDDEGMAKPRPAMRAGAARLHGDGEPSRLRSARRSAPCIVSPPPRVERFAHKEVPIGDPDDPQDVAEFEHIIYRSLRERESAMAPLQFRQDSITLKDRNMLIDAMDRFHYKLSLTTNALYRFIGILDRFCSVSSVPKHRLHLYGCAALFLASKIEDVMPAQSDDLIELSQNQFTQRELFAAEIEIINAIQFDTTFATPLFYLTHITRIHSQTKESLLLARYILELCQTHEKLFGVPPALIASVAVMVTRILIGIERWPRELAEYSMHSVRDLDPLAAIVHSMLLNPDREESRFIQRKYESDLFLRVALVEVPEEFPS